MKEMNNPSHFMAWWLSKYNERDMRPFPKKCRGRFLICGFLPAIEPNLSVQVSQEFWIVDSCEAKDRIRALRRI
jgi:hypothetical protein